MLHTTQLRALNGILFALLTILAAWRISAAACAVRAESWASRFPRMDCCLHTAILTGGAYASHAHSAPVFVTLEIAHGLGRQARAKDIALSWIARLDELEARLSEDRIGHLTARKNRASLLSAIRSAKGTLPGVGPMNHESGCIRGTAARLNL